MRFSTLLAAPILCIVCATTVWAQTFNSPEGLAVDSYGNLWVANYKANTVVEINGSNPTATVMATILPTQGLNGPTRLAFDQKGNLFVVNTAGNSVTEYSCPSGSSSCTQVPGGTFAPPQGPNSLNRPLGIAIDLTTDDEYIVSNGGNNVYVLKGESQAPGKVIRYALNLCAAPGAAAFDSSNQILYVGCGPTAGTNQIFMYAGAEQPNPLENQGRATFQLGEKNTGPTGISLTSVLGGDLFVSFLYSGTAVDYINSRNVLYVLPPDPKSGGCEGIAVRPAQGGLPARIFVSNSTSNTISVYQPASSTPPQPPFALAYILQ
jgi:DNA-binding beta-propeller fold protein YncE